MRRGWWYRIAYLPIGEMRIYVKSRSIADLWYANHPGNYRFGINMHYRHWNSIEVSYNTRTLTGVVEACDNANAKKK